MSEDGRTWCTDCVQWDGIACLRGAEPDTCEEPEAYPLANDDPIYPPDLMPEE